MKYYRIWLKLGDDNNELFPRINTDQDSLNYFKSIYDSDEVVPENLDLIDFSPSYDQDSSVRELNDFVNWQGMLMTNYEVISEKTKSILGECDLGIHSFNEINVKTDGVYYKYYIFQNLNYAIEYMIYEESTFTEWKFISKSKIRNEIYKIKNKKEYKEVNKDLRKRSRLWLGLDKLVMNEFLDWFHVPVLGNVISERLLEKFYNNSITGVNIKEISEVDIIFKHSSI